MVWRVVNDSLLIGKFTARGTAVAAQAVGEGRVKRRKIAAFDFVSCVVLVGSHL